MAYNAILFDLDGTLLDTLADLADAMNRVLTAQGFPAHPLEAYRYFIGNGAKRIVTRTLPESARSDEIIQRSYEAFMENYGRNWNVKTCPYPGIPEMLDRLSQMPVKLAVLSNKPDVFTQDCVTHLLPTWKFEVVFGQREGIPKKPDPTSALDIAATFHIPPKEFLYLGDTAVDMQTAVAAGMTPVGVLWGFRERDELLDNGAQVLLDHPMQVCDLF